MFSVVFGLIGTIAVAQKNEEAGFQLAVMAIALTLTCFLFAFLIDVLTDMRHYLKRIAEKQYTHAHAKAGVNGGGSRRDVRGLLLGVAEDFALGQLVSTVHC